jgi:3-hydroxyisobutyrate dehydrogenase-like beta-hydroxyacid dehydrogenase
MKIGIIGAGQIGGTLTRRLTALGHDVAVEEKTRFGILSTLSSCGEVGCAGPERPKLIWPKGRRCFPVVIAG